MIKRRLTGILTAALLLSACSFGAAVSGTPKEEQTPLLTVTMEDTFFAGSIMESLYRQAYTLEDRHEDERLQKMIASVELDYPIDTQEEICTMAWALYDHSMELELFGPELKPNSAERYAEGIWRFTFSLKDSAHSYYDGDQASFLISGEDGHIITFRDEMLFLDPYGTSIWSVYNGSDDRAPGERPAILQISWINEPYKDPFYPIEEWSTDDRFDNERWQEIAAGIDAEYPLIEEDQITDWAWKLQEGAAKKVLMKSWHKPWYATHYNDGIWQIIFETGTWKTPMGGTRIIVLISDMDGHVIHVEEDS